jgi:predicted ATPase
MPSEAVDVAAMTGDSPVRALGTAAPGLRPAAGEVMPGRTAEQKVVRDLLRRAQQGRGGVVLVEAEPGMGKSTLLRKATGEAAGHGFSLAPGAADQLGRAIPFSALRTALPEPFTKLTAGSHHDLPDATAWSIGQLRVYMEQRAAANPVVVCLDDLQWASPATLAALRTLPRELKWHPVAWVLAR